MTGTDTIVAIATPPGRGGISIVRVSGPAVAHIAVAMLGDVPPHAHAVRRDFKDSNGAILDNGVALFFAAPRSFTGEDVLELHGHGGPVVQELVVAAALDLGARAARGGEFSERAFLNNKIDLVQAEAVADLINASSAAAAKAAVRSLQGEFSARVNTLADALLQLRMHVEAAIDFADEDLTLLEEGAIAQRIRDWLTASSRLQDLAQQGMLLRDGCTVVIAGRPNAGKSSLMNALSGEDVAIVSATPGTTRDVLRATVTLDGLPVLLLDTAGLRVSEDAIEQEGVRRARKEIERADRVLYVVDSADQLSVAGLSADLLALPQELPVTVVLNKIDLCGKAFVPDHATSAPSLRVSVTSGEGFSALRSHLKESLGYQSSEASAFSARRRHVDALQRAHVHVMAALHALDSTLGVEIIAEELKLGHASLGEITGQVTSEDLLGAIFASFCIGK